MKRSFVSLFLVVAMLCALSVTAVFAEGQQEKELAYPTKPVDFLIPFGAGGSCDVLGRTLIDQTKDVFEKSFVPINKTGGGGSVMYQTLYNSKPDGYTVGWSSTSVLTTTNIGNVPFAYDVFAHVCRIGYTSMPLAIRTDSPYGNLEEFIQYAKDNPGKIKIANAGTGSGTHLTAVVFAEEVGIDVSHVPIGADRRMSSLLGGEGQAICVPLDEVAPHVKSGDAKILAFPTEKRNDEYPDVPTLQESGYDVVIELFRSISVPKDTPQAIIEKLEATFEHAAGTDAFMNHAEKFGFQVDFMGHEDFEEYLAKQDKLIAKGMKLGGLVD